jgi:hypothetical protein
MPTYVVHALNAEFSSRDIESEYDSAATALATGVEGAVRMVADEVRAGKTTASVVVTVEQPDGQPTLRSVVTLAVSALMSGQVPGEAV